MNTTTELRPYDLESTDLSSLATAAFETADSADAQTTFVSLWDGQSDGFHDFLESMSKYPLLREEEQPTARLAKAYLLFQSHCEAAQASLQQSAAAPTAAAVWAAAGYDESTAQRLLTEGKRAARRMVQCNLRLIVTIAKKYPCATLPIEDRVQEGALGLMRAVEKFDPDKGYKFSTYAYWWVRQGITRAIATQSRTIRLPNHIGGKQRQLSKATKDLKETLHRLPTAPEIATACAFSLSTVQTLTAHQQAMLSLNHKVGEDGSNELLDLVGDTNATSSEEQTFCGQLSEALETLLAQLEPTEQDVIKLRFGLVDGKEHGLEAIGQQLGLSREQARQAQAKGMRALRKHKADLIGFC